MMKLSYHHLFRKPPVLDNTVWLLGCSFIWGTAIADDQTIPYLLEKQIGYPVDNLGIQSASPKLVHYVLNDLLLTYKPRAIIISWPFINRTFELDFTGEIVNMGPWSLRPQDSLAHTHPELFEQYKNDIIDKSLASRNRKLIANVFRTIVYPYLSFRILELSEFVNNKHKFLDYAGDGMHPGPRTVNIVVDHMTRWYKKL